MSDILLRLSRLVEEHARERGWTATSVVSGQPRFASVIAKLPEWLLPSGAPASHESESRSASAAT